MSIDGFMLAQALVTGVPLPGPADIRYVQPLLQPEADWLEHKASFHLLAKDDTPANRVRYKWSLCTQILALANTHGGALVIGVSDDRSNVVGCLADGEPGKADRVREQSNALLVALNGDKVAAGLASPGGPDGYWIIQGARPLVEVNPVEVAAPTGSKWLAVLTVQLAPEAILARFEPAKGKAQPPVAFFRKPGAIGEIERIAAEKVQPWRDNLASARGKFAEMYARLRADPDWRSVRGFARDPLRGYATPLEGRDAEVSLLMQRLDQSNVAPRLFGLIGRPGIGKSVLIRDVARRLLQSYQGRIAVVDVSAAESPAQVVARMCEALVPERPFTGERMHDRPLDSLISSIASLFVCDPALLVLDGCDRLKPQALEMLNRLPAEFPKLKLVYTSDRALQLTNAETFELQRLSLEPRNGLLSPAAQLLAETAAATGVALPKDDASRKVLERAASASDGHPVVIRTLAGLSGGESFSEFATKLVDAIKHSGHSDPEAVLGGVFKRTMDSLSVDARRLARALTLWGSSFSREQAILMAQALTIAQPAKAIAELITHQVLELLAGHDETMQIPAQVQKLLVAEVDVQAKDSDAALACVLAYSARGSARAIAPETLQVLTFGALGGAATVLLLSAAGLSLGGVTAGGAATAAAGLLASGPLLPVAAAAAGVGYLWHRKRKKRAELEAQFVQRIKFVGQAANALLDAGFAAKAFDLIDGATKFAEENDMAGIALPVRALLGRACVETGRLDKAITLLKSAADGYRQGPRSMLTFALKWLTFALEQQAQLGAAGSVARDWVLQAEKARGVELLEALFVQGRICTALGQLAEASLPLDRALAIATLPNMAQERMRLLLSLARLNLQAGKPEVAERFARELLHAAEKFGSLSTQANASALLAEILAASGHVKEAARLYNQAARLFSQAGDKLRESDALARGAALKPAKEPKPKRRA